MLWRWPYTVLFVAQQRDTSQFKSKPAQLVLDIIVTFLSLLRIRRLSGGEGLPEDVHSFFGHGAAMSPIQTGRLLLLYSCTTDYYYGCPQRLWLPLIQEQLSPKRRASASTSTT